MTLNSQSWGHRATLQYQKQKHTKIKLKLVFSHSVFSWVSITNSLQEQTLESWETRRKTAKQTRSYSPLSQTASKHPWCQLVCGPHHNIQSKEWLWFSFVFLKLPSRNPHSHLFLLCLRFTQNEHGEVAPEWNPRPCDTDTLCNPVPCSPWDADTLRNSVLVQGGMQSQVAPFLGKWLLFLFYQYHFLPGFQIV